MNNITVDLFISMDFEGSKAIRKVSDNLITLRCILSMGKDQSKSVIFVKVTSKTRVLTELKPSTTVRINGFLAPVTYKEDYSFMDILDDVELPFK